MIVIVGESASGKSTVEKILQNDYGYNKIVSFTTRKPRDGEINGIDYYFVDDDEFIDLSEVGFFIETATYNGWNYGTPKNQCVDDAILVATPHGLRQLKKSGIEVVSFYIYVPRRDRLVKILQRGDNIEEAYRRSLSDVGQYDGIKDEVDYVITNDGYNKTPEEIAKNIVDILKKKLLKHI